MPVKPLTSPQKSRAEGFPSYERLLWSTLSRLAHSGYFVPPDESRDVIHDFYVEAWAGLLTRYDPGFGDFPPYVAGAFYQFARRRLVELDVWRSKLVDLDALLEHPTDSPSPPEQLESSQRLKLVRLALESLPGSQRQVLIAYMDHVRPSERAIALRQNTSRHAVRRALAEGIANLTLALERVGLPKRDVQIAQFAWRDGRATTDIANRVNVPTQEVLRTRKQLAQDVCIAAGKFVQPAEGVTSMSITELLRAALFDEDRERANSAVAQNAEQIRRFLLSSEGDAIRFTSEEETLLRKQPERLGRFYEHLNPATEENDELDATSAAIDRFQRDQIGELVEAFESMLYALPAELKDWDRLFTDPGLTESQISHLLRKPVMREAGSSARSLAKFGLTPEVFAETFGGFSLLLSRLKTTITRSQPVTVSVSHSSQGTARHRFTSMTW